ncbi:hypothetical protein LTS15_010139 [Exophiala xenobiotica]|nr:hypothetical protein LTS15_010139 [Exophiala xenobiotica]
MMSLEAARRSHPFRPLLFIAHSLGGIVVKEMLRQSWGYRCHQTHLQSISNSTAGALFFGTPHGGADPGGLVRSIAESIARLLGWRVNEKVLDTLLPSSERLRQLRDEFGPIAHEKRWIIHCFQEEYPVKFLNGKVVEDSASCLNDATIETVQHIAMDHMDMCRFSGLDDPEYTKVAAAVERVLASAFDRTFANNDIILDQKQRQKYVESLKFDQIDARHATIRTAHAKTCKWLLTRPEYRDWRDPTQSIAHGGFLWIKGKPGSGKSTIMKYAFTQARNSMTDASHISFFLNARGEQLEKTTLGMYRSLLLQLLEGLPDLPIVLNKEFELKPDTAPEEILWTLEKVKTVFQAALRGLGDRKVVCYIDALDESEEDDVRDMISFFEQVCEKVVDSSNQFFVCFSSRHYPHIGIAKSIELVLEEQAGHREDLAKYLDSELRIGSSQQSQDIKQELLERACGIFLWVVLVVHILRKEYERGRVHALRKRLDEIPNGLHELFSDILTRDGRNVDELVLCLQWILYARRPLKREELYFAVLTGVDPRAVSGWDPDATTTADMERFILDCSKGLAELTKTKHPTVQFIHESVRDFLFKENSLGQLQPGLTNNFAGISHDRLKAYCQDYLATLLAESIIVQNLPADSSDEFVQMRRTMCEKWPLLDYAVKYMFEHADAAGQHEVSQHLYLERLMVHRSSWIYLNNMLERDQTRRYTSDASFLYIFAEKNLPSLIRLVLNGTPDMDIAGERHRFPLNAAIQHRNQEAIREFLRPATAFLPADRYPSFAPSSSTKGDQVDVAKFLLQKASDIGSFEQGPVLAWAVACAEQNTIACLVATGKVDLNIDIATRDPKTWSHVCLIVEAAQLVSLQIYMRGSVVRFSQLLYTESLRISTGSRRLLRACYLMQNVFNIQDEPLEVPLKVLFNEAGVMEFLIHDNRLDPNQCEARGGTCLMYAAELGLKSQLQFLLKQKGLDINAANAGGETALYLAAWSGHEHVVRTLLRQPKLDVNKPTDRGWTGLHRAVMCGHANIVEMLLTRRSIDLNQRTNNGETALDLAVSNGHDKVVRMLLEQPNLDVNKQDDNGWTALHRAAMRGREVMVETFLKLPYLDVNQPDKNGSTALHRAVASGRTNMVAKLMARPDLDLNKQDDNRWTALHHGVQGRYPDVLEILLGQDKFLGQDIFSTVYGHETSTERSANNIGYNARLNQRLTTNVMNVDLSPPDTDVARTRKPARVTTLNRRVIDVNATDQWGGTALFRAVEGRQLAMVKMLLKCADINILIADNDGETPLQAGQRFMAHASDVSRETFAEIYGSWWKQYSFWCTQLQPYALVFLTMLPRYRLRLR